ncbi:hypothetical protein V3564_01355 [Bartonella sp. B12(2025)]
MIKIFKNHVFSIFIVLAFFLSQIVHVNANYLKNSPQPKSASFSVMKQGKKETVNMAALHVPSFIHGEKNEIAIEGKIEKVFEPITIGVFTTVGALGFGTLIGSVMAIVTAIIGWAIGKTQSN